MNQLNFHNHKRISISLACTLAFLVLWGCDQGSSLPTINEEIPESDIEIQTGTINPVTESIVALPGGVTLVVPPGAVDSTTEISIYAYEPVYATPTAFQAGIQETGFSMSYIIKFEPEGLQLNTPAYLEIPIHAERVYQGLDPEHFIMASWDSSSWDTLETEIDLDQMKAGAQISRLSEMRVVQPGGEFTVDDLSIEIDETTQLLTLQFDAFNEINNWPQLMTYWVDENIYLPWFEIRYNVQLFRAPTGGAPEFLAGKQLYKLAILDNKTHDITAGNQATSPEFFWWDSFVRSGGTSEGQPVELMEYRDLFSFAVADIGSNNWEGAIVEATFFDEGFASAVEFHNYGSNNPIPMGQADFLRSFSLDPVVFTPVGIITAGELNSGEEYFFKIQIEMPIPGQYSSNIQTQNFTIETVEDEQPLPVNLPPRIVISSPANGHHAYFSEALSFTGTANDPEDGQLSGDRMTWRSSLDDIIGSGNSLEKSDLSIGVHTISLAAADNTGQTGLSSLTLEILNNMPVITLTNPDENAAYEIGEAIEFAASANDVEDGVLSSNQLAWSSNLAGALGTGANLTKSDLSVGLHTITLDATDSHGAVASSSRTILVFSPEAPAPNIQITAPISGMVAVLGEVVIFSATATDNQDGDLPDDQVAWISNIDGSLGTGTYLTHTGLSVGQHVVTATATDSDGNQASATTVVLVRLPTNTLPVITSLNPPNGAVFQVGSTVTFTATVNDAEDGALTGEAITWTSSLDGALGSGETLVVNTLSQGTHSVTLQATDSREGITIATLIIQIIAADNTAPSVVLLSPSENDNFQQGQEISFAATVNDQEDGTLPASSIIWTSSADGQIGTGLSFVSTVLSEGQHQIDVTATDSEGASSSRSAIIQVVGLNNTPPTLEVLAPVDGSVFTEGETVNFSAQANDAEDGSLVGSSIEWISYIDGLIGTGSQFNTTTLSRNNHTITITATDSEGAVASAEMVVQIVSPANTAPTVSLSSPPSGSSYLVGTAIDFIAVANDVEDGELTGNSIRWVSNVDGQFGTGASLSFSGLSVNQHIITVTVTDSDGAQATASSSIQILAAPNTSPEVAIIDPADQATFITGDAVTFTAQATDAEDGSLSGPSIVWRSNINGVIGNGLSLTTTNLSTGAHIITVTATDSEGSQSNSSIEISVVDPVNNPPSVFIVDPQNGDGFIQGTTIEFFASATDIENGQLSGPAIVWTSDKDGLLGSGEQLSYSQLSVDYHIITCTATDANDLSASDQIAITVSSPPPVAVNLGNPSNITSTSLNLAWSPSTDNFYRYRLYMSQSPGVTEMDDMVAEIDHRYITSVSVSGLFPSTTYYFKVFVVNGNNESEPSNEVNGTTLMISVPPVEFDFITIPGGDYTYGSGAEIRTDIQYDFDMMSHEVTNSEYLTYLQTGLENGFVYIDSAGEVFGHFSGDEYLPQGSYLFYILNSVSARIYYDNGSFSIDPGYEEHPVTNISWFGAYSFARFWGMTLPTEFEWEKAARGVTGFQFPWGDSNPDCGLANYRNCVTDVQEVGIATGLSPFGLYDMAGNVMEWTTSPAAGGNSRISRGGSWDSNANAIKTYWRNNSTANGLNHRSGFRCIVRP